MRLRSFRGAVDVTGERREVRPTEITKAPNSGNGENGFSAPTGWATVHPVIGINMFLPPL
jgi:hypothetical protein